MVILADVETTSKRVKHLLMIHAKMKILRFNKIEIIMKKINQLYNLRYNAMAVSTASKHFSSWLWSFPRTRNEGIDYW